jgi:glutathione S-transferase
MILHHYDASPFSEKIRLMLGYCAIEWQSLVSPAMPPRSNVDPLTGGYRRMPVAQSGADIFCDTAIISEEIAAMAAKPELAKSNCDDTINNFISHAEFQVFFALAGQLTGREAASMLFRTMTAWEVVKFIKDRLAMTRTATVKFPGKREGKNIVNNFHNDLESKLGPQRFLFGETPCIADFSAYHPLWFRYSGQGHRPFERWPKLNSWFNTMSDFGQGIRTEITTEIAFDRASSAEPRALPVVDKTEKRLGASISIGPGDYAQDQIKGTLVGSTDSRWIISRDTEQFGTLHVHFPKAGFELVVS